MTTFKPMDLMQGYSLDEQADGAELVIKALTALYGNDKDMHACILSFALGYSLAESKIPEGMAIAMVINAKKQTEEVHKE